MSQEFEDAIAELQERDARYARDAYVFVFEALAYTQRTLGRQHHVSGQELLDGIRALAQEQFGFLARTVFREWGLHSTEDFGYVVFNLVESNLMGKQDTDTIDDFIGLYDFAEVFEEQFTLDTPEPVAADVDPLDDTADDAGEEF